MKPIDLNLVPRRGHFLWMAMGFAALVVGAVVLQRQHAAEAELQTWQRNWEKLGERHSARSPDVSSTDGLGDEITRANRLIARLNMPWGDLFAAIDATVVEEVALLAVEPDSERREVRISGEAKDHKAMLDYVRAIQGSPVLKDGHVVSYQVNHQDLQKAVRFTAVAVWSEPFPAGKSGGQGKMK